MNEKVHENNSAHSIFVKCGAYKIQCLLYPYRFKEPYSLAGALIDFLPKLLFDIFNVMS